MTAHRLHDPAAQTAHAIPAALLAQLQAFSVGRLEAGHGAALIAALGFTPGLIRAYEVGYLPPDYAQAIGTRDRAHVEGLPLAGRLILPARDAQGQVVDLLTAASADLVAPCLGPQPQGVLGRALLGPHERLILVDALADLARLFAEGHHQQGLVRALADDAGEAQRRRA